MLAEQRTFYSLVFFCFFFNNLQTFELSPHLVDWLIFDPLLIPVFTFYFIMHCFTVFFSKKRTHPVSRQFYFILSDNLIKISLKQKKKRTVRIFYTDGVTGLKRKLFYFIAHLFMSHRWILFWQYQIVWMWINAMEFRLPTWCQSEQSVISKNALNYTAVKRYDSEKTWLFTKQKFNFKPAKNFVHPKVCHQ